LASKNVDVVKVVFCTGSIDLAHTKIPVARILLDSDALHGNYLSENFLHKNGGFLYHLMEDTEEVIILADSTKKCQVTKKISLQIWVFSGLHGFADEKVFSKKVSYI
jgi:hypothetical protein